MTSLGGNSLDATQGDAGVPTTGAGGFPFFPGAGAPTPFPGSLWAGGGGGGSSVVGVGGGGSSPTGKTINRGLRCIPPVVLPLLAVVNVPPTSRGIPAAVPSPAAPARRPVTPPPAPAPSRKRLAQSSCRTGNICLDIRNGCVLGSQVSPDQLLACSQAGYAGNANLYAQFDIDYGGFLGSPDPNPPPFDSSMLSNHPGLSGLGDTSINWGAWILGTLLVGFAVAHNMPKRGR